MNVTSDANNLSIGFVLLTHNRPADAARLIGRLHTLFGTPPIAWHHDFGQCPEMPRDGWGENVRFVTPHTPTKYCRWPNTLATLRAIRQLYRDPGAPRPDWFYVLSGLCYPIKPASVIRHELATSGVDAFTKFELIHPDHITRGWHHECIKRYLTKTIRIPWMSRKLRPMWKQIPVRYPKQRWPFFPFTDARQCYAGTQWIALSKRAADELLDVVDHRWPALTRHYENVWTPEESFMQTALKACPDLKIANRSLTLSIWEKETDQHPKVFGPGDLDLLRSTDHHFARKFVFGENDSFVHQVDRLSDPQ
ncbi:MAG: beta-1,6-N-acetylglucosaminyltransferase [Tepidisphaeraceae bacterium]